MFTLSAQVSTLAHSKPRLQPGPCRTVSKPVPVSRAQEPAPISSRLAPRTTPARMILLPAPRSQEDDDVGMPHDPKEGETTSQEVERKKQRKKEQKEERNRKATEQRKAKRQHLEDLRAAAQRILGLSAKDYRRKMREFLALLPGTKEQQLLTALDPESLRELLTDPGAAAAKLIQLSMDHPGINIPAVIATWPLILTTRHRPSYLLGHTSEINCIAFGPDRDTAVTGDSDNLVRVWDLRTGTCTAALQGHTARVLGVAVSSDGRRAVSAGADHSLRLWDLESLTCLGEMRGRFTTVLSVALTPDDTQALGGSMFGNTLTLWDLDTLTQTAVLVSDTPAPALAPQPPGSPLSVRFAIPSMAFGVAISADGLKVVSAGTHLILWDLPSRSITAILQAPSPLQIWCLAMSPDGRRAVVGCNDAAVRVWDLDQGVLSAVLEGHVGQVRCVAVTPDGRYAVSGSNDGTLRVWDLDAGSCQAVVKGHTGTVLAVAIAQDGRRLVSGGHDDVARVWDLQEVLEQGQVPPPDAAAAAAAA